MRSIYAGNIKTIDSVIVSIVHWSDSLGGYGLAGGVMAVTRKLSEYGIARYRLQGMAVIENIVVSNIQYQLCQQNILTSVQRGFGANRTCETQLMITIQDIPSALNKHRHVDIVVVDVSKAFGKVSYQGLLHKFRHYGISGPYLS